MNWTRKLWKCRAAFAAMLVAPAAVYADTVSINLHNLDPADQENHTVAIGDIAGIVPVANWNNIGLAGGNVDATVAPTSVNDSLGVAAATFESTLTTAFVGNTGAQTGVVAPKSPNRDFMQSYLSFDTDDDGPMDVGTLSISGLGSAYTSGGYSVILYGDADRNDRLFTVTIDGQVQTLDDGATFNGLFVESDNIPLSPATGSQENYLVFSGLTSPSFTIDMQSTNGRGAVNAIQITTEPILPPHPVLEIDRLAGTIDLVNMTASPIAIKGYSITSGQGALDQSHWVSIADNYDATSGGEVDDDEEWLVLTDAASKSDLSEATFVGGSLGTPETLRLGDPGTWIGNPIEDLQIELLLADGSVLPTVVSFVGNGGNPISAADLNADGTVDPGDWLSFRGNWNGPLLPSNLSAAQLFQAGDVDGDFDVDRLDFLAFKQAYISANGAPAFAALVSGVPEPSTAGLGLGAIGLALWLCRRRPVVGRLPAAAVPPSRTAATECPSGENNSMITRILTALLVSVGLLTCGAANAQSSISINLWNVAAGNSANNTVDPGETAGVEPVDGQFWNNISFPGGTGGPFTANQAVIDNSGNNAATFVSTLGSAFVGFSGAAGAPVDNGDRNMMTSYLSYDVAGEGTGPDDTGNLTISGLGTAFTTMGYDVYIYGDADVNNRTFSITVNGVTNQIVDDATYDGTLTLADGIGGDNENYTVFQNLTSSSFSIEMDSTVGRGAVNGIQIVADDGLPDFLSLGVNTTTGEVRLRNDTGSDVEIDYYEIRSAEGDLVASGGSPLGDYNGDGVTDAADYTVWRDNLGASDESAFAAGTGNGGGVDSSDYDTWRANFGATGGAGGWFSLQDQDIEGSGPPGDGLGWEEGDNVSSSLLFEAILEGGYAVADGADISLGNAFTPGGAETLIFEYHVAGTGATFVPGVVNYGTSASLAPAGVPEPTSFAIAALGGLVLLALPVMRRSMQHRRARALARLTCLSLLLATLALVGSRTFARVTNDREYYFGSDSLETASDGAFVGSNNSSPLATNDSADGIGPTMAFLDLTQANGPTYANVSASGLMRPGAGSGQDGFGVRFDGVDDRLTGIPLNRPDELASLVPSGTYPLNYTGITTRGIQLWVYPDAAALGSSESPTTFQSIVSDTQLSGGPAINAAGQWTQINSGRFDGGNAVPATVEVAAGDTWYHVMHHNYLVSDPAGPRVLPGGGAALGFTSVVYVDGIAVSANNDNIPLGSTRLLAVGAAEVDDDVFDHHFTGVVDDLEMYVYGNNEMGTPGNLADGEDWGTFDLFADNAWIANEIANDPNLSSGLLAGDANLDGEVNGDGTGPATSDDVSAFIDGWLREKVLDGARNSITVGDWETWGWGDFDHNGQVNLQDWELLTQNHPNGAGLSLAGLLGGAAVPEPGSLVLLGAGAVAGWGIINRRGRTSSH